MYHGTLLRLTCVGLKSDKCAIEKNYYLLSIHCIVGSIFSNNIEGDFSKHASVLPRDMNCIGVRVYILMLSNAIES